MKASLVCLPRRPLSSRSPLHPTQLSQMHSQQLISITKDDKVVGPISKHQAHQNTYIFSPEALPHRAFSFFAFDKDNRLLIHQRSKHKITFPGMWTNSCCSHPLYESDQMEEYKQKGIRLAVQKRVQFELGLSLGQADIDRMVYLDRILYRAKGCPRWGEYELDYVFFLKKDFQTKDFSFHPEEISAFQWVTKEELSPFLERMTCQGQPTTPWFAKIVKENLN